MSGEEKLKSHSRQGQGTSPGPMKTATKSRIPSCVRCQQRKVKCDRNNPCSGCLKAHVDCTSTASTQPRRRKKRFPEAALLARLRRYEEALELYGADIDALRRDDSTVELKAGNDTALATEDRKWCVNLDGANNIEKNSWTTPKNEFLDTEELLRGSSDDELDEAPITTTWASMNNSSHAVLLFGFQHNDVDLVALHPQPMHIIRLWQQYLDNVNPLVKILHGPTFQLQVLEASTDLGNVSRDMEALLFSIYSIAVLSMSDAHCKDVFGDEKSNLMAKYQFGAQQALLNAEFLRPSTLAVLQAFVLYLLSLRGNVDPRSLSCLTSISLRIGQYMGLHRNEHSPRLPPFEVEMRRRLWWQIVLFDSRVAEFSGVGTSVLTHQWNTRLPLNVNDGDLYPDMKEPPMEHTGVTEMVFCLTRCEIGGFLQRIRASTAFSGCWHELSTPLITTSMKDKAIEELEQALESKYLKYCDPSISLHFISATMARSAICKLKHISHHPRLLPDRGAYMPQAEKDKIFLWALKIIEYSNMLHTNKSTQKFRWHIGMNKPIEAFIHVLNELRYRTSDDLADQAWRQMTECSEIWLTINRPGDKKRHTALHIALAALAVKAWDARESALQQSQPFVLQPAFITELRLELDLQRSVKSDMSFAPTPSDALQGSFGMVQYPESLQPPQPGAFEMNASADLAMLMGSLPMDNPMDWMSWTDLTWK